MAEYIEREAVKAAIKKRLGTLDLFESRFNADIDAISAADVVSKGLYNQVKWERDIAIKQLREEYGVGFGEKKRADVVDVNGHT